MSSLVGSRRRQIDTLRIFNVGVAEIQPQTHYSLTFDLETGNADGPRGCRLLVYLPPSFPGTPPAVTARGPTGFALSHPWLEGTGGGAVTRAPGLLNYSVASDLGRVVLAIKRELARAAELRPETAAATTTAAGAAQQVTNNTPVRPAPLPPPSSFPGLSELPRETLKELAEGDPGALATFSQTLDALALTRQESELEEARARVEALLLQGEAVQKETEEAREELFTRVAEAHGLREVVSAMTSSAKDRHRSLDPSALRNSLTESNAADEEESDKVAEAFLAKEMATADFLKEYLELRTKHHTKKVKLEQLKKLTGYRPRNC